MYNDTTKAVNRANYTSFENQNSTILVQEQQRLIAHLFKNYDNNVRPVSDPGKNLSVEIVPVIRQIVQVVSRWYSRFSGKFQVFLTMTTMVLLNTASFSVVTWLLCQGSPINMLLILKFGHLELHWVQQKAKQWRALYFWTTASKYSLVLLKHTRQLWAYTVLFFISLLMLFPACTLAFTWTSPALNFMKWPQ